MHLVAGAPRGVRGRIVRPVLGAILVGVLLATAHPLWLSGIGDLLLIREAPVPADGVVILGGDGSGGRILKGAQLVHDGWAPTLYVIDDRGCVRGYCLRWSEIWRDGAQDKDPLGISTIVPRDSVVPLLDDIPISAGTYEEARAAWDRLEPMGIRRILLVTDEFHSRRATMTWRKIVAGRAAITSVPCATWCTGVGGWWTDREAVKAVWLELLRLGAYVAMGHV